MCQSVEKTESFPKMVTYMTENFVNKLTNGVNPYFVTTLTLNGKNKTHKIKSIENLNRFTNLQHLSISHNNISRIDGLDKLVHLKHLNLSWNCINSMNGLERLNNLLLLDLTGNGVRAIPLWLSKKLCKLKTLHLAKNNVSMLDQLCRLRDLHNLTTLSFLGNPAIDQIVLAPNGSDSDTPVASQEDRESTYRLFALFHLRTLLVLDGKPVTSAEFEQADKRFGQTELSNLTGKIRGQEERVHVLEQMNATLEQGLHTFERRTQEEQEKINKQSAQIDLLKREIQAKDQLLQSRSEELARACLKYYELEQELAFHKIDSKLAHFLLGPPPSIDPEKLANVDATGNYPYLGRCRFRRLPVALSQTMTPIHQEHVGSFDYGSTCTGHNELEQTAGQNNGWSMANLHSSTPRYGYAATGPETICKPPDVIRQQSEQSEDTALGLSNRSTTPTDRYFVEDVNRVIGHDSRKPNQVNDKLQSSTTVNDPVRPLSEGDFRSTCNGQQTDSTKVNRTVGVDESGLRTRVNQLETELQLAWNLARLHQSVTDQSSRQPGAVKPAPSECGQQTKEAQPNNSPVCLPPPSPRARSGTGTLRLAKRERSTSLPGPESNNPRATVTRTEPTRASFEQVGAGESATLLKSRSEMDCDSPNAIGLHYSGTSSTPSSRTTGTGRSVIPSNYAYESARPMSANEFDRTSIKLVLNSSNNNASSSGSNADLMTQLNPTAQTRQPHSSIRMRKPGVGLSQAHDVPDTINLSDTSEFTEKNGHIVLEPQPHASTSMGCHLPSNVAQSKMSDPSRKSTEYCGPSNCFSHQIERFNRPPANQFDPHCSSSNHSAPESWAERKSAAVARDSIVRTPASGASMTGTGSRRRKRRVLSSLSSVTGGGMCRVHRVRARRSHRPRRESADTFEGHAEELLDLLVTSRKACASEVDKMRADLAWIQRAMPRLHASCGHMNLPHSCSTDGSIHNSNNPYGTSRVLDSRETRADGAQGTVRSYMDSLTNVTRPSPNGPQEMSSFSDEDDDDDIDDPDAVDSYQNSPATRARTLHEAPPAAVVLHRCDLSAGRQRGRRLLPAASNLPDDQEHRSTTAHEPGVRIESRANRNLIPFASQWTPDYHDLDRMHGCGSPVRGHARQASSIPRDFHRVTSLPVRTNTHSLRHRTHRHYPTRASAPGLIVSPPNGSRPPRGRSLDTAPHYHQSAHHPRSHRYNPAGQRTDWMGAVDHADDEDPSTETAALLNLTEELVGLRHGLKQARRANAGRLEIALRQIGLLELELQRQRCLTHDAQNARERQVERSRWERCLSATLAELKQCQRNIGQLRAQMDQLATTADQNATSQTQFERQKAELDETKSALDAQKAEITRLNRLLNKLLGVDPSDASPVDLAQIQDGLVELNRTMQTQTVNPSGHLDPVRRTQSLHTGLASGLAEQPRLTGFITPTGVMARASSGNLYCNVPEHHYLEDCMDQLQTRLQESQALQTEQQKKLRQATKAKRKLEKQIEEQNLSIDQLNAEATVQHDELAKVTGELKRLAEEKENAQKSDQMRLSGMATDMSVIETAIKERRTELTNLETKLRETNTTLSNVQAEARDASKQLDEARAQQSTLEASLGAVQAQIKSSRQELAELQASMDQARSQAQKFDSTRQQLASEVRDLEEAIRTKQAEFKHLSSNVDEVDSKLTRMRGELDAGDARLKTQQKLMAEDEAALNERRTELRRLSQKIIEDESRLESLAREIGQQRTELELIQAKQQRELDVVTQDARETATKAAVKQRELAATQSSLNSLMDERNQLTAFVESLRAEQNTLQLDLQEKQKTLTDLSATLLRQRRELEHTSDMARLEETRLHELTSQQRDVLEQLHSLQAQVRAESSELRGRDVAKLKKSSELQVARSEAEREQTELQRLTTERQAAEAELSQVQQQTSVARTQLNNMRHKVQELEKHESEILQSISEAQRQLAKITAEREAEVISLRGLRHERASSQIEYEHISKCLDASRAKLERAQERLTCAQSAAESQDSDLADQQRRRIQMTDELNKLGEAVHLGRLAKQNTDDERESSESALQLTRAQLDKTKSEKQLVDEELQNTRRLRDSEQSALKDRMASGNREIESLDAEVAKRKATLKSLNEKVRTMESRLAELDRSESKCLRLEQRLEETERELKQTQKAERQLRAKLTGHTGGGSSPGSDLARVLEETKAALAASQRDSKRLKRRTTRELTELERIAEEQCQRAAELTEQLSLVKRQYAQLKGQVASQTELTEHGRRLEAALAAVRAELEQNVRDEEDALFQTDPTVAQALYSGRQRASNTEHEPQTASDLHRSLLVLTNSFHDLCHPSATTTQPHSRSLLTLNDFHRSTPGIYRPVLADTLVTGPGLTEVGESTTGTCRTGTTSGLGSSLNPTANMDQRIAELADASSPRPQDESERKNGFKDKLIDRVAKQREQNAADWEHSNSQFHVLRDQVDHVREQLDRSHASIKTHSCAGSRRR